jgi:NAD(P)-dependent dehydrogenase (short-subunit alcohol dehydrogenase family)
MGRLQGKVAIVTGAGGGIGSAICRQFAAEGAALVGVDIDVDALARTAAAVHSAGSRMATSAFLFSKHAIPAMEAGAPLIAPDRLSRV